MKLFKNKLAWAAPIAVILIIALFSVNLFAQGDPKVKNLPIALVLEDAGNQQELIENVLKKAQKGINGEEPTLSFTKIDKEDLEKEFKDKNYYGALVIPKDFSEKINNILANGEQAQVSIYLNQGFNNTGSNFAKTALTSIVEQINNQYSMNFEKQLENKNVSIKEAKVIIKPIEIQEKILNPITASTANGSAPTLMAVPSWVGALIGGFVIFLALSSIRKNETLNLKQNINLLLQQISFGVIIALLSGLTVATLAELANINMPSFLLVTLFVAFAAFCFFLLVSAITAWIGKPAITLFMVVMLLGMGVLMTPQEMLPSFFVDFIRPWIPLRFASEGLREIFYFGSGFYTGNSFLTILYIGISGLIILILSLFKKDTSNIKK